MQNEMTHVKFLRAALGPLAVPQPAINIGSAFAAAADAAAGACVAACSRVQLSLCLRSSSLLLGAC